VQTLRRRSLRRQGWPISRGNRLWRVERRQTKVSRDSSRGWKAAVTHGPGFRLADRRTRRDKCKGDFERATSSSSSSSSSKQPAAACIMQAVGNGRTRNVCRMNVLVTPAPPLHRGVNLMRPAQKGWEPTNEWPNERCAAGLRDFPEEISKHRRRRYRYGKRSIRRAYTRLLALLDRQMRTVKRLKYSDNVTRTYISLNSEAFPVDFKNKLQYDIVLIFISRDRWSHNIRISRNQEIKIIRNVKFYRIWIEIHNGAICLLTRYGVCKMFRSHPHQRKGWSFMSC